MADAAVKFGMSALATALRARAQILTGWDVSAFVARALNEMPDDAGVRDMVADFAARARFDMPSAGERLQAALEAWLEQNAKAQFEVIGEAGNAIHEWQRRKDCGHD